MLNREVIYNLRNPEDTLRDELRNEIEDYISNDLRKNRQIIDRHMYTPTSNLIKYFIDSRDVIWAIYKEASIDMSKGSMNDDPRFIHPSSQRHLARDLGLRDGIFDTALGYSGQALGYILYFINPEIVAEEEVKALAEEVVHSSSRTSVQVSVRNETGVLSLRRTGFRVGRRGGVLEEGVAHVIASQVLESIEKVLSQEELNNSLLGVVSKWRIYLMAQLARDGKVDDFGMVPVKAAKGNIVRIEPEFCYVDFYNGMDSLKFSVNGSEDSASGSVSGSLIKALLDGFDEAQRQEVWHLFIRSRVYPKEIGDLYQQIDKRYGKGTFQMLKDIPERQSEIFAFREKIRARH